MKWKTNIILVCSAILAAGVIFKATSQETQVPSNVSVHHPVIEYASVRFMEEKTSIVWSDATVENVMTANGKQKFDGGERYPKGADYRMYWLTVAMNRMGKRGFEFVCMDGPDVVMKRQVSR